MKRFRVLVTRPAEEDIEAAYDYIRRDSAARAVGWRESLGRAARRLQTAPRRCPLAPENGLFRLEIRQLVFGNYRVLFTIADDAVHILHVRHAARRTMTTDDLIAPGES